MFGPSVSAASHKMQASCQFRFPGATAKHPEKAVLRSDESHTSKDKSHIETCITSSGNGGSIEPNVDESTALRPLMWDDGYALTVCGNGQVTPPGSPWQGDPLAVN